MSDWLYCHKHDHGTENGHGDEHSHTDCDIPSVINNREQFISYLIEKGTGCEIIFEDESNQANNLIVTVISPSLVAFNGELIEHCSATANLFNCILIEFKLLLSDNEDQIKELKRLRSSFTTEWTKIKTPTMGLIVEELVQQSKQYLPKTSLIGDNHFIRSLIKTSN